MWKILCALTAAISMVFIDITVLPVALPTIGHDLQLSPLILQWIVNAYTLTLTILVLLGGRLGDHFGLRRAFTFGICLFALASALCGVSRSALEFIASRSLQGIGGALMLPTAQGIIAHHFPPQKRGKALGIFVSMGSIFLISGPLIGGYLTQYLSWHYVFWINLPIAATGLVLAIRFIPSLPGHRQSFDGWGFVLSSLGIGSLVLGIMQLPSWGFIAWASIALGAILLYQLKRQELRHAHPLVPFDLIRTKAVAQPLITAFIAQCIVMIAFFWSLFFQVVLAYPPSYAGLLTFVANMPIAVAAPLAGYCTDRFGSKYPTLVGFTLIGISLAGMISVDSCPSFWSLFPFLLCFGMGIPLVFASNATTLMNAAPSHRRGTVSGLLIATRQFSSTLGIALFGMLYDPWSSIEKFNLIHVVALVGVGIGLFYRLLSTPVASK